MNYQKLDEKLDLLYSNYTSMKKKYLYQNLQKFEPKMFFDQLYDTCFDNIKDFEDFAYTIIDLEQESLNNISDVLQYLVSVACRYNRQKKKKSIVYDDEYFLVN